jgi:hypothetical protein
MSIPSDISGSAPHAAVNTSSINATAVVRSGAAVVLIVGSNCRS